MKQISRFRTLVSCSSFQKLKRIVKISCLTLDDGINIAKLIKGLYSHNTEYLCLPGDSY